MYTKPRAKIMFTPLLHPVQRMLTYKHFNYWGATGELDIWLDFFLEGKLVFGL